MSGERVLVTSGGTSEPIDRVRRITNVSTGRLGSLIADAFTRAGAAVDYVYGESAVRPSLPSAGDYVVGGVRELSSTLERLLAAQPYRCVVHAMAVSDYTPRRVTTADILAWDIAGRIARLEHQPEGDELAAIARAAMVDGSSLSDPKIGSDLDDMLLLMGRVPKVIDCVRKLQPHTCLVGFKLLAGSSEEELARASQRLIERAGCDYVLANDIQNISGDNHRAILVGPGGILRRMETKQEIAEVLAGTIMGDGGAK